ncbi:MAG: GtrA family protein [Elusimicrobiota bacterium]
MNLDNKFIKQFCKYTIVGGVAFCVDYFLLWFLTEFAKVYYLISSALSFMTGLIVNYILSIVWVFDKRRIKNRRLEFLFFGIIGIIGLIINQFSMWFLTEKTQIFYLYSKIIAAILVLIWNFTIRKILLF